MSSGTYTYTTVDVGITFESFTADLRMLAARTQARSDESAKDAALDVQRMAEHGYVERVHVMLYDASGTEVRARVYEPRTDAQGWRTSRPKDNDWPRHRDGSLRLVVERTPAWHELTEQQETDFRAGHRLHWGPTSLSTSHSGLSRGDERRYASNAYGLLGVDYARAGR